VRATVDIVSVSSGTSVPGIAEANDGTGDADVQMSTSVQFRGKTDHMVHKGKSLGKAISQLFLITTMHLQVFVLHHLARLCFWLLSLSRTVVDKSVSVFS